MAPRGVRTAKALKYMLRMYESRSKWASFCFCDAVTLGATSTQRSEGCHDLLKRVTKPSSTLTEIKNDLLYLSARQVEQKTKDSSAAASSPALRASLASLKMSKVFAERAASAYACALVDAELNRAAKLSCASLTFNTTGIVNIIRVIVISGVAKYVAPENANEANSSAKSCIVFKLPVDNGSNDSTVIRASECACRFSTRMCAPCRHGLALARELGSSIRPFAAELRDKCDRSGSGTVLDTFCVYALHQRWCYEVRSRLNLCSERERRLDEQTYGEV
jgi:hypothetical protein